jgi:hypothetical protein
MNYKGKVSGMFTYSLNQMFFWLNIYFPQNR